MMSLFSANVFAIIALCFTILLARRNVAINNRKNMIYIAASVTTIILLILEIVTNFIFLSSTNIFIIPHRIANLLGFSLSPLVPFILLFFNRKSKKNTLYNFFLILPLLFNTFMCILSYNRGYIFFVNDQNQYTRGNLFLLPTTVSIFYYLLFLITVLKNIIKYEMKDKVILITVFLIPILAIILQILFKDLILIWSCTSISLLIYYIFLLEVHFTYDVQTKIKNRAAFEKEMDQIKNSDKTVTIIIFDLNNLKTTNDKYGHKAGDDLIFLAAKIIEESFIRIGKAYRIGGDEFCVLCIDTSKELIDGALSSLDELIIKANQNSSTKIGLAYGYAFYNKNEGESIYSTFANADKAMYTHKSKLKGFMI